MWQLIILVFVRISEHASGVFVSLEINGAVFTFLPPINPHFAQRSTDMFRFLGLYFTLI